TQAPRRFPIAIGFLRSLYCPRFKSAAHISRNPGVVRGASSNFQAWFWYDGKARFVVGGTAFHCTWFVGIYCLCNLGGVSGRPLSFWELPFPLLFSGDFRRFTSRVVRTEARMVAGTAAVFPGPL